VYKDIDKEKNIQLLYNDNIYSIFIPLTYNMSEKYGWYRWCTSYSEEQFKHHDGNNGQMLYIINKLDYTKTYAIEIICNTLFKLWDFKDNNINKSKYFEDIINFLEFDEDLINILEDIKYDININKKFNREENIDAFVDYVIDGQSESDYFEYLSRRKCLNYLYKYLDEETSFNLDWLKDKINYYIKNMDEFIECYNIDDIKYVMKTWCSYDNIKDFIIYNIDNDDDLPDNITIEKLINILFEDDGNVEKFFDRFTNYRYKVIKDIIGDYNSEYIIDEQYNSKNLTYEELIGIYPNFNYKDFIRFVVKNYVSDEELIDFLDD
jgi:hypothetical protein